MENDRVYSSTIKQVAGIIPVSGQDKFDFGQVFPDFLMPIAPNYSLIEASVVECAWAGCKTIWIVANDDIAPLIRKVIGNWISDPVWVYRKFDPSIVYSKRRIPIYYVPVRLKDRDKVDSLSWSVLQGAFDAYNVGRTFSEWISPDKYYVSFPYSYFPPEQLREHRRKIASSSNCYISSKGETVKDGHFSSFTFGKQDWLNFRRVARTGTGRRTPGSTFGDYTDLPPELRWSARWFSVDKIFEPLNLEEANEIPVENYFNIRSWEEYKDFISASRGFTLRRPSKSILIRGGFNKIGGENEDEGGT